MTDVEGVPNRLSERLGEFTGRNWVRSKLETWLSGPARRFVLAGGPGSGKSMLSAHLVNDRVNGTSGGFSSRIQAWHFCRALDSTTLLPERVIGVVARQLAGHLDGYADVLTQGFDNDERPSTRLTGHANVTGPVSRAAVVAGIYIGDLHLRDADPERQFDSMVRRPLVRLDELGKLSDRIVILVDGLDEAVAEDSGIELLTLLSRASGANGRLPAQVRFMFTTRDDDRVLRRFRPVDLDLITDSPANIDDIRSYATGRLATGLPSQQATALAIRIADLGGGNFLYARYVLDELSSEPDAVAHLDPRSVHLPGGLNEHYREFIDRELARRSESWEQRYRPLLSVLVVAGGEGLKPLHLSGITGLESSEVDDALLRLKPYLVRSPSGSLRIFHQSFAEYLHTRRDLPIYPDEAQDSITEYFVHAHRGRWLQIANDNYVRHQLITNAAAADRLDELLSDPTFLLVADPGQLLRVIPSARTLNARQAGQVFSQAASRLLGRPTGQRVAYFDLQAHQAGVRSLTDRIERTGIDLPWSTRWAKWRAASPSRIVGRHDASVVALAFGKIDDNPVVVAGFYDGWIITWDLANGALLGRERRHRQPLRALVVGSVGEEQVVVSAGNRHILRCRLRDGEPIGPPIEVQAASWLTDLAIGHIDDRCLLISGDKSDRVRVWDLADGRLLRTFKREYRLVDGGFGVNNVAGGQLRDGPVAVTGYENGDIFVWDLATHARVQPLYQLHHDGLYPKVSVGSLEGRPVFVSASSSSIQVWDLADGSPIGLPWISQNGDIHSLAVAQLGERPVIIAGGSGPEFGGDEGVRVAALADGSPIGEALVGHDKSVAAIATVKLDGRQLIVTGGREIRVWDLDDASALSASGEDEAHRGPVTSVVIGRHADRAIVVSASGGAYRARDSTIRAWSLADGSPISHWRTDPEDAVHALAVAQVGKRSVIVTAGEKGVIRLWDLADGRPIGRPRRGHEGPVYALAFAQLGGRPHVISGGIDRSVRAWNLTRSGFPRLRWGRYDDLKFVRPHRVLGVVEDLLDEGVSVRALAARQIGDRQIVVAGGSRGSIWVYDLSDGSLISDGRPRSRSDINTVAVGWLNGSPVVVAGGGDTLGIGAEHDVDPDRWAVRVWDLLDGTLLAPPLTGFRWWVNGVATEQFEGRMVIAAGGEQEVRLWELDGNRIRATEIEIGSSVYDVAMTPAREIIVAASKGLVVIQARDDLFSAARELEPS